MQKTKKRCSIKKKKTKRLRQKGGGHTLNYLQGPRQSQQVYDTLQKNDEWKNKNYTEIFDAKSLTDWYAKNCSYTFSSLFRNKSCEIVKNTVEAQIKQNDAEEQARKAAIATQARKAAMRL
jgi:hypothetical protein